MAAHEKQIPLIIQFYKAQTCQGQAHLSIYSANTGKSLGGAIRVGKEKLFSPKETNLFQVTGCQHRKLICEKNFKKLIKVQ